MSRPTYLKIWLIRRKKEYSIKRYSIKEYSIKDVENSFLHAKEKKLSKIGIYSIISCIFGAIIIINKNNSNYKQL